VGPVTLQANTQYVIIPCTNKPKEAHFTLAVFAELEFELEELTKPWDFVAIQEGEWKEANNTAGGSPNNADTFTDNPQYSLKFSQKEEAHIIVEVEVPDSSDGVGFIMVRDGRSDKAKKLTPDDVTEEDIFAKPEGWKTSLSITQATHITEEDASDTFVIIPSTFKPNVDKSFTLRVYSDKPIQISAI
jgi:hypothetical protein